MCRKLQNKDLPKLYIMTHMSLLLEANKCCFSLGGGGGKTEFIQLENSTKNLKYAEGFAGENCGLGYFLEME